MTGSAAALAAGAPGGRARRLLPPLLAACAFSLNACASYVDISGDIRDSAARGDHAATLARIEKIDKETSKLLYLYEKGLAERDAGNPDASAAALEEAAELYDDLYTKSVSREIGALLTSDNVVAYRGERFEAAYGRYVAIQCALDRNDLEAAGVEARRLNERLAAFQDDPSPEYPDDPFLQFLTGLVYARRGEWNDADVSFRAARDAYAGAAPPALGCEARECVLRFGETPDSDGADCSEPPPGDSSGYGTLVLLLECGAVPYKFEESITVPIFKGELDEGTDRFAYAGTLAHRCEHGATVDTEIEYVLKVAVPEMTGDPTWVAGAVVRDAKNPDRFAVAATASDLGGYARSAFEARRGEILVKTMARGIAKYLAKRGAENSKGGEIAGMLVNAFNYATERADTRSWTTLPDKIFVARLALPAGEQSVEVELEDASGEGCGSLTLTGVEIVAGRDAIVTRRVY